MPVPVTPIFPTIAAAGLAAPATGDAEPGAFLAALANAGDAAAVAAPAPTVTQPSVQRPVQVAVQASLQAAVAISIPAPGNAPMAAGAAVMEGAIEVPAAASNPAVPALPAGQPSALPAPNALEEKPTVAPAPPQAAGQPELAADPEVAPPAGGEDGSEASPLADQPLPDDATPPPPTIATAFPAGDPRPAPPHSAPADQQAQVAVQAVDAAKSAASLPAAAERLTAQPQSVELAAAGMDAGMSAGAAEETPAAPGRRKVAARSEAPVDARAAVAVPPTTPPAMAVQPTATGAAVAPAGEGLSVTGGTGHAAASASHDPAASEPQSGQAHSQGQSQTQSLTPEARVPAPLFTQTLEAATARPAVLPYDGLRAVPAEATVTMREGRFGGDVGVAIAKVLESGPEGMRDALLIRLDPRHMGRIDVRMSFEDDGTLRAVVSADQPAALDMLRRESTHLDRALSDAGVRADAQSLRFDGSGANAGANAGGGQQRHGARPQMPAGEGVTGEFTGAQDAAQPVLRSLRGSGLVDLMA